MSKSNLAARTFTTIVISMGLTVLMAALIDWQSQDPVRYCYYFLLALLSSGWKVGLPAIPGTVSIGYLFVLIGIVDFSLPETLLMGCTAVVVQSAMDPRERMAGIPILFRVSNLAIAVAAGDYVFQASWVPGSGVSPLGPLAAVAVVLCLMNTFPAAVLVALSESKRIGEVWHQISFWTLPNFLAGAVIATVVSGLNSLIGWKLAILTLPVIYYIYRSANRYLEGIKAEQTDVKDLTLQHLRTIETLGMAIEARRHCERDHLKRTQTFALGIGRKMGLSQPELQALRIAANLHDVGILAVPEQIISKKGRLTKEEYEKVKSHPGVGAAILERVRFPFPVAPIVKSHHEKWDGTGYPNGLKGEQIPLGGRILAVVDCLAALIADRPYRKALSFKDALAYVESQSGASFDPDVVKILLKNHQELERLVQLQMAEETRQSTDKASTEAKAGQPPGAASRPAPPDFVTSISAARRESEDVFELARDLGNSLNLNETLSTLATRLKRMVHFDCLAVYIRRDDKLVPEYVVGTEYPLFLSIEIPVGKGLSGWVAKTCRPLLNGDPSLEFSHLDNPAKTTTMGSAISVPLEGSDGTVGVLALYRRGKAKFQKDHFRVLLEIRSKLALAIENAMKYQVAANSATTDPLTGLANARSLFLHLDNELARCRRTAHPLTVLVCDLDGFKLVNDQFGHMAGNKVLCAVSKVLQANCREYDYVSRMGGDEFVMVLPGLPESAVETKIRRLSMSIMEEAQEVCPGCQVSISVGQARYPGDGQDTEELLAQADRQMYRSKQRRKMQVPARGYDFDWVGTSVQ